MVIYLYIEPVHGMQGMRIMCQKNSFSVEKWPDAVQERTRDGMLPIHIACYDEATITCGRNDDAVATEIIRFLVRAWPESILIAFEGNNIQGRPLPLDLVYQ